MNKLIEKNKPHKAFLQENGKNLVSGTQIKDPKGSIQTLTEDYYLVRKKDTRTLYDGRYCAVSGFIFAVVDGKYSVLANRRGQGAPDFKGYWNCPCGFLEADEDSIEGIKRETQEECGIEVPYDKFKVVFVETDPWKCNNGNVTIRHRAFMKKQSQISGLYGVMNGDGGGEIDEVTEVKWIPVSQIDRYPWAFNHKEVIKEYAASRWIQKLAELIWK